MFTSLGTFSHSKEWKLSLMTTLDQLQSRRNLPTLERLNGCLSYSDSNNDKVHFKQFNKSNLTS